ncbi:MAG TPA: PAS domain-containing protein [Caulobacteraceae bacterium]
MPRSTKASLAQVSAAPDEGDSLFCLRVCGADFVFESVNSVFARGLGLSESAIVGKGAADALPRELAGLLIEACRQCLAASATTKIIHTTQTPAGPCRWQATLTPLPGGATLIAGSTRKLLDPPAPVAETRGKATSQAAPLELSRPGNLTFTIGRDWRISSVTPECAIWWRFEEVEIVGLDCRGDLIFPSPAFAAIQATLTTGQASRAEFRSRLHPGLWMEMESLPIVDGVLVRFWDVTAQKVASHGSVLASETPPSLPTDETVETVLLDQQGVIVICNIAWRDMLRELGLETSHYGKGEAYVDVCSKLIPELNKEELLQGLNDVAASRTADFVKSYMVSTPMGLRWRQVRIARIDVAGAAYLIALHEDLSDAVRAQAEARKALERAAAAREQEREHLAAELHDSTGQHLAVLSLNLHRLRRAIGEQPGVKDILDDMSESVQAAAKEIRLLSYLMKPPSLDLHGLAETTRRLVSGIGVRAGIASAFKADGEVDAASPKTQRAAFRFIQEALSNVFRHAAARRVDVELVAGGGVLTMRVADDGKGIEALRSACADESWQGAGLASMRSRMHELGGTFDVVTDHSGTVVTGSVPLM